MSQSQPLGNRSEPLKQRVEKALEDMPAYKVCDLPGFVAVVVDSPGFMNHLHLTLFKDEGLGTGRQYRGIENYRTHHYLLFIGKLRGED